MVTVADKSLYLIGNNKANSNKNEDEHGDNGMRKNEKRESEEIERR